MVRRFPQSAATVIDRAYRLHEARTASEHFHGKRLVSKMLFADSVKTGRHPPPLTK
jgi:hypothetical protein